MELLKYFGSFLVLLLVVGLGLWPVLVAGFLAYIGVLAFAAEKSIRKRKEKKNGNICYCP